jgi:NAD(P)-dependent dehydrogenase (short-subunit alcohol dehydrogenase family)
LNLARDSIFDGRDRLPVPRREKSMTGRIEGKVAIVTGAGSGMGLSTAIRFHAEGALVVLADISGKEQETATKLGDRAVAIHADISRSADAKAMVDLAMKSFGGVDILCNIAGIGAPLVPFADATEENFDFMIDVNLRGAFLTMKYAVPHMLARGGGSIVNVSSTGALIGIPQSADYSAAKAGMLALTRVTAIEYARSGIRVNAICPGFIRTPMVEAAIERNPGILDYVLQMVPMGRAGKPEEIASTILFLASDESSYITGVVLPVDAGQTVA